MARTRDARRSRILLASAVAALVAASPIRAEDRDSEIRELRRQVEELLRRDRERERRIGDLERRLEGSAKEEPRSSTKPETAAEALDRAVEAVEKATAAEPPARPDLAAQTVGPVRARLLDLSLDVLAAAGGSTEDDESLERLQAGGHDPRRNGFTLQQVELSAMGAVDPYFDGEAHVLFFLDPEDNETVVELEEAFATTRALPHGIEIEAGHFLTEFGRLNPTHPHAWNWLDQPVVNTRMFGGDGMRNPGVRVGWLLPLPWFAELHLGMQDATGETMASFLGGSVAHAHGEEDGDLHLETETEPEEHGTEDPEGEHGPEDEEHQDEEAHPHGDLEEGIGGRPIVGRSIRALDDFVYLARLENGFDLGGSWSGKLGGSGLFGPNATGDDGRTKIYGADLVLKWRPAKSFRGWPFFVLESEVVWRDFRADRFLDQEGELLLRKRTLHDWGFYAQGLYGFSHGWAAGLRVDHASGDGPTAELGRRADPFRDDRLRISPLLVHHPTEFSRLRLQYSFDDADHLDDDAHSVWFGVEILYGAHPAHAY